MTHNPVCTLWQSITSIYKINTQRLHNKLETVLDYFDKRNGHIIVIGDLNINFLKMTAVRKIYKICLICLACRL